MANRKKPTVAEKPPLSDLAKRLIRENGIGRLRTMLEEYQAGLPLDMNPRVRQDRIEAISEIFSPTEYHQWRVDPAQFI